MLNDPQKNFYDVKRQFQGKDDPGTVHPEPGRSSSAPPMNQIVVGVAFLFFVVALAVWHHRAERAGLSTHQAPAPSPAPAAAPKH